MLKEFQTDYPKVDFRLMNGDYHDVEEWLSDGSIDIGFVNVPCGLDCECIPLMEDRLLAIHTVVVCLHYILQPLHRSITQLG